MYGVLYEDGEPGGCRAMDKLLWTLLRCVRHGPDLMGALQRMCAGGMGLDAYLVEYRTVQYGQGTYCRHEWAV